MLNIRRDTKSTSINRPHNGLTQSQNPILYSKKWAISVDNVSIKAVSFL